MIAETGTENFIHVIPTIRPGGLIFVDSVWPVEKIHKKLEVAAGSGCFSHNAGLSTGLAGSSGQLKRRSGGGIGQ